jgi:hypothetical protein
MRARLLVLAATVSVAAVLSAQQVDPALRAAIDKRDKAAVSRDVRTVDATTADDYSAIAGGNLVDRQTRLGNLAKPLAPGTKPGNPSREEALAVYGTAAVRRAKDDNARQLQVWVKTEKGWQMSVAHVVSDDPPPPPGPRTPLKSPETSPLNPPANLGADQQAVFAAFKRIQDAFFAGDRSAYMQHTGATMVRIAPGGIVRFGQEVGRGVAGIYAHPRYDDISVKAWGQVGVVRWRETAASGRQGWLTRVFVKDNGAWKQIATASSPAASAAGTQ